MVHHLRGLLPSRLTAGNLQRVATTIFDTVTYTTAAEIPMLVGLAGRSNDRSKTNLELASMLPNNQTFVIGALGILIGSNVAAADVKTFLDAARLTLKIGERTWFEATADRISRQSLGLSSCEDARLYDLAFPIEIPGGVKVDAVLSAPTLTAASQIRLVLDGALVRQ